jgi:hypothetical protein
LKGFIKQAFRFLQGPLDFVLSIVSTESDRDP